VTVSGDFRVDVRPYSGYRDPGLPIASWIAQAGSVGDASGGVVIQDFFVQLDGAPHISELYNLEQISVDTSSGTVRDVVIETRQMDILAPNRRASPQKWKLVSSGVLGNTNITATQLLNSMLPLWLGSPNRDEGDAGLRLTWTNIDLLLYAATLQGYIWGPRSVLAEGGPRRPVGGLFGP